MGTEKPSGDTWDLIAGLVLGVVGGLTLAALYKYLFGGKCPQCNQTIPYKANPCPKCGTHLRWN